MDRYVLEHGNFGMPTIRLLVSQPDQQRRRGTRRQLRYQANCAPCRWHHLAPDSEAVVEAAHDHAMPGWRDLPVMPFTFSKRLSPSPT